jgi:hypothetical protein
VPNGVKSAGRAAYTIVAAATGRWRLLPDHLIIGGQRCGTTSLHAYLAQHPLVPRTLRKEVHYFDLNHDRGVEWYRRHFATVGYARTLRLVHRAAPSIGEATPDYVFFPHVARLAHELLPEARLIALLRDPVDRAFSHYQKERARGFETLPFAEAVEREPERLEGELERMVADPGYHSHAYDHHSYLARGVYADQLSRWLELYPRDQLLAVRSEDMFRDPALMHRRVLEFLDLPVRLLTRYPRRNLRPYGALDPKLRERLRAYFRPHNERLSDLLGADFTWEEAQ